VPIDLVTASASGLDPHISVAAAHQLPRIARLRGVPVAALQDLVARHTEGILLGFLASRG
jgi:K+-transporting ATPase ATPase C chain